MNENEKKENIPKKINIEENEVDKLFREENKKLLKEGKMLIRTGAKFIGYDGSTPFVEIDQDFQQMPLERTKLEIPRENLTRMFPLAYLAGKLSAIQQGTKIGIISILLIILVLGNIILTFWRTGVNSSEIKEVSNTITTLADKVNNISVNQYNQETLLKLIAIKENIVFNETMISGG